ncbi:hypothetical protein NQ314_018387 [Rhamnusium bicolor]|uniref:Cleavage and polyadenylation specificity factor subunit 2 n=1 Tax=Rhamnusium bicolor TaxID=1586634 RepID=A0AAV8WS46_9CUCU|nr:hypothetical protein NQ314_018387 [Rhamnusium bicolor]
MYPMYPFHEEKIKCDEYGEIVKPEDYKLVEVTTEAEDNKENIIVKKEEEEINQMVETGRIILEGCISEDYYRVKDLLYEQYAIL